MSEHNVDFDILYQQYKCFMKKERLEWKESLAECGLSNEFDQEEEDEMFDTMSKEDFIATHKNSSPEKIQEIIDIFQGKPSKLAPNIQKTILRSAAINHVFCAAAANENGAVDVGLMIDTLKSQTPDNGFTIEELEILQEKIIKKHGPDALETVMWDNEFLNELTNTPITPPTREIP